MGIVSQRTTTQMLTQFRRVREVAANAVNDRGATAIALILITFTQECLNLTLIYIDFHLLIDQNGYESLSDCITAPIGHIASKNV